MRAQLSGIGIARDRFGRFKIAAGLTFLCGLRCFAMESRFLVWSHHTFRPYHWGNPRRFLGGEFEDTTLKIGSKPLTK